MREEVTAGEVFARRMREVRRRRDWSQADLANRLKELGHPIHRVTLTKIEQGGKETASPEARTRAQNVALEDVLAISFALGVSPIHMIVPRQPDARLRVVSGKQAVDQILLRAWLRGESTLLDEDPRFFFSELPLDEFEKRLELGRARKHAGALLDDLSPWAEPIPQTKEENDGES